MKFTPQQTQRYKHIKSLHQMQQLESIDFERFTAWLYQQDEYQVNETAVTQDEGVDLILHKWGKKTIVQCKRYTGTVGQPTVRDLYGVMIHTGAQAAHLVTTGTISHHAESWVAGKSIELIDGHDLVAWVNKNRRAEIEQGRGWLVWATGGLIALLLFVCVAVAGGAYWIFSQRTASEPAVPLVQVPTPVTTTAATEIPVLAPTATLPKEEGLPPLAADLIPVIAVRTSAPPVIDGALDEWSELLPTFDSIYRVYNVDSWDRSEDLNATWRLTWDENHLYIGILVQDDTHVQTQTGNQIYRGDSLDMQIDTDKAGDAAATLVSPDDFQIIFSPGDFGAVSAEVFRFRGTPNGSMLDDPGHAIRMAAQQTAAGYTLEAAIPWADLAVVPANGLVMGLNLNANDNDTPSTAVQEVMLSNVSTRTFRNPTTWGILRLEN